MKNCCGIYKIDCNGKCLYIGQSINTRDRKNSHLRKLRKNSHNNIYLQRLYNKYGEYFIFSLVEECEPKELTNREMFWIKTLKPSCNMQIPSNSTYFTITEESRKRMSDATKSRMNDKMRQKISQKTKEAMHRPDVWSNFIQGQNNKKNKTAWNKGLKGVTSSPNKKEVFCVELNMKFDSAYSAGVYVGAKNGKGVSRVCLKQRNTYKNMHWYYI